MNDFKIAILSLIDDNVKFKINMKVISVLFGCLIILFVIIIIELHCIKKYLKKKNKKRYESKN